MSMVGRSHNKLIFAAIVMFSIVTVFAACTKQQKFASPPLEGTSVAIDISSLPTGTPLFFTYQFDHKSINFFVLRSNNEVRAYLDACTSCYPHKRGYKYENGTMTCRNCGLQFPVRKLKKGLGGCYPICIDGKVDHGKYLIPVALLKAEISKF